MTSPQAATKTILDLKLETQECKRFGYILTGKFLGQGAYANVFLGHPTESKIRTNAKLRCASSAGGKDVKVAIKIINIDSAPKVYISKFLPREIATMNKSYKHVNVLQLYDMFATVKRVYLVLELASAGDLLSHINRCCSKSSGQSVSEENARTLFKGVASGLRFIHRRGIAHRDLKCENILLTHDLVIKICDFGFAIDTNDSVDLLKTHCGSYAYASPEILRQQRYDGKMADLWSLGVVLFAMVNGGLPFKESDAKSVLEAMKKPVYFRTSLSAECKDLIRGLLRIKPRRRYTIDEVVNHPWITQLKPPDCALAVKADNVQENGNRQQTRAESKTPNHEMMSDPDAVSKYICSQMKKITAEKPPKTSMSRVQTPVSRAQAYETRLEKDKNSIKRSINAEVCHSVKTYQPAQGERASTPQKTGMTYYFKATLESLEAQVTDLSKRNGRKTPKKKSKNAEGSLPTDSNPAHLEGGPLKLQSIYDACKNDVAISTKCALREESPLLAKSTQKREIASPNVVNIRIDQMVDLISSSNGNDLHHHQLKRKNLPLREISTPLDFNHKQTGTPNKESSSLEKEQRENKKHRKSVPPRPDGSQVAKVNIIHLEGVVDDKSKSTALLRKQPATSKTKIWKSRNDGTGFSKTLRQTPFWDYRQKSALGSIKYHKDKGSATRAFTTPCKTRLATDENRQSITPAKSPTNNVPSRHGPNNKHTRPQFATSTVSGSKLVFEDKPRNQINKDHMTSMPPCSKNLLHERGEVNCARKSKSPSKSCSGSSTNISKPIRPSDNPADAWELRPKTHHGRAKNMDVHQLLKYQVNQERFDNATKTRSGNTSQSNRYCYWVSSEAPKVQMQRIRSRKSAELNRPSKTSSSEYVVFSPPGNKILYRRAHQPKQTMQTIQQLKKQARYAARSKKHFLPLPSCGVLDKGSPTKVTEDLSIPAERLYNSQTVVLRMNKT